MTEHPRMLQEDRVRLAAAFALKREADGFTKDQLAEELRCSDSLAAKTRDELQRQLTDSPYQLTQDMRGRPGSPDGWLRIDPDNTHHDVRLYCLKPRVTEHH